MPRITLSGCTATPFGAYLKSLGIFRLVSEQADSTATASWEHDTFQLETVLTPEDLQSFFLKTYSPTPILAPWNGGSGFYPKDNQDGMNAILSTDHPRFTEYRDAIKVCRAIPEVQLGKVKDENERRTAILRRCRNQLPDRAVEWLDAAVGIAADGSRSFAPVLGTGGNEGRLDYTNNFMTRLAALLISPPRKTPVDELLKNALFNHPTSALQDAAAGQFDPGRAGGANQGPGVEHGSATNPWDFVLTLEGAVAWASGLYRRQGTSYQTILCSPFTVRARAIGYGSAAGKDKESARAEIWTPLWDRPVTYRELRTLLREGRASVEGRPATNAIEFAEAACSLGIDRNISRFVRYSLLKRRGDSYVALPAGTFPTGYRAISDHIRAFMTFFEALDTREWPEAALDLRRNVESAVFQALLTPRPERTRELLAVTGQMLRRAVTASDQSRLPARTLRAATWLEQCDYANTVEVRIAAALASIFTPQLAAMSDHLNRSDQRFAWLGADLTARLISVLDRRLRLATAAETRYNPLGAACAVHPGDVTLFLEKAVDDNLIESLLFAFATLDWQDFKPQEITQPARSVELMPVYQLVKHLFLGGKLERDGESQTLTADPTIVALLASARPGAVSEVARRAVHRLRIARMRPLAVDYEDGLDPRRLAAALLIPVWTAPLANGIFHAPALSQALA